MKEEERLGVGGGGGVDTLIWSLKTAYQSGRDKDSKGI